MGKPIAQNRPVLICILSATAVAGAFGWLGTTVAQRDRTNRALIRAIKSNDTTAVTAALEDGADPSARDNGGILASALRRIREQLSRFGASQAKPDYRH